MDPRDKIALKQLALRNALLSKKQKIEGRRERLLSEMNRLVAERRTIEVKITTLDAHLRERGEAPPPLSAAPAAPIPPSPAFATAPRMPTATPPAEEYTIPDGPTPPPPPRPPEAMVLDRLATALTERYREADFGIQEFHALMNELAPEANFKFETAWRVVNDLLTRHKIKQVSQKMTDKGLVRRFKAV